MDLIKQYISDIRSKTYGKDNRESIISAIQYLARGDEEVMSLLDTYIETLRTTTKGEEMRTAIADALNILSQAGGGGGGDFSITFDKNNNLIDLAHVTNAGPPIDTYLRADPYVDEENYVVLPFSSNVVYTNFPIITPRSVSVNKPYYFMLDMKVSDTAWGALTQSIVIDNWQHNMANWDFSVENEQHFVFGRNVNKETVPVILYQFMFIDNSVPVEDRKDFNLKLALWNSISF